jgi:hypothetical protein
MPYIPSSPCEAANLGSHLSLFNDERYQRQNLRSGERLFRHDHFVGGRLVGTLSGVVADGVLECGHSAPFGGPDFARDAVFVGAIGDLLRGAGERAKAEGAHEMVVRAAPGYCGANEAGVEFALLNLSARVARCEVSLGLQTGHYQALDAYEASLKSSARRALRHGLATGFDLQPATSALEWAATYELLAETRHRRGVRLSISFDYLMALREIFGRRIAMHRLVHGAELAGAALVYRVRRDLDYVVAWGDDTRYRPDNAVNVIAYHLVGIAIGQGVGMIDLGISSVDGVPDDGLIQFKRNIGAVTGLRLDFRLPLR